MDGDLRYGDRSLGRAVFLEGSSVYRLVTIDHRRTIVFKVDVERQRFRSPTMAGSLEDDSEVKNVGTVARVPKKVTGTKAVRFALDKLDPREGLYAPRLAVGGLNPSRQTS